jgi:hypothetical protein
VSGKIRQRAPLAGDNGIDPSFPDVVCVEFAHADGYLTVEVEQIDDAQ